jgi:RNA polymerase sigma factor (sigma-70 family)
MSDFALLFHRHWPDVLRFALYLCGNEADAEDLASEAFLRAWTSTQPIRVGTVKSYLFVIVRNLYCDRLRRRTSAGTPSESLPSLRPGPDVAACDRAELDRVVAAMQLLPESDRAILAMAAFASMPHDLIGAALGISVAAVKVRIHRARLKVGVALQQPRNAP